MKAAIDAATNGTVYPGNLPEVITPILPAVQQTLSVPKSDQLEAAAEANVQNQARLLAAVPLLADRVTSGALKIVGGIYNLHTGKVDLLP